MLPRSRLALAIASVIALLANSGWALASVEPIPSPVTPVTALARLALRRAAA